MERYHFWLAGFDTRPLGCPPSCGRVIHCRVDEQELRLEPEPGGSLELSAGPAELPCDPPQAALETRLVLPLSAIIKAALEPQAAPCSLRLELDRDLRQPGGQPVRILYLAALDPLDEHLGASSAETAVLYTALTTLAAGRSPYHLDPNPYHRAFARLGRPELAHRKQWNPAASPRALARHSLVGLAQAIERFRQFNAIFWPVTIILSLLAWSLARQGYTSALFAVSLLLAGMALTWLLLSWQAQAGSSSNRPSRLDDDDE